MKRYENPMMEIAFFEADDVITASGQGGESPTNLSEATDYAKGLVGKNTGAKQITITF